MKRTAVATGRKTATTTSKGATACVLITLSVALGAILLVPAPPAGAADGKAVFEETCQLCHGEGIAGSPKFGDKAAWGPRIAKGLATLQKHAINGFEGNAVMPPKGGNPDLSDEEVKAAVAYMVEAAK